MNRIAVESSLITSIGWTPVTEAGNIGTLEVEFPRKGEPVGSVYEYYEVLRTTWEAFQSAESKGKFFLANIKGKYGYKKIESETEGR